MSELECEADLKSWVVFFFLENTCSPPPPWPQVNRGEGQSGNMDSKVTDPNKKSHYKPNAQDIEMFVKKPIYLDFTLFFHTLHQNNTGFGKFKSNVLTLNIFNLFEIFQKKN